MAVPQPANRAVRAEPAAGCQAQCRPRKVGDVSRQCSVSGASVGLGRCIHVWGIFAAIELHGVNGVLRHSGERVQESSLAGHVELGRSGIARCADVRGRLHSSARTAGTCRDAQRQDGDHSLSRQEPARHGASRGDSANVLSMGRSHGVSSRSTSGGPNWSRHFALRTPVDEDGVNIHMSIPIRSTPAIPRRSQIAVATAAGARGAQERQNDAIRLAARP